MIEKYSPGWWIRNHRVYAVGDLFRFAADFSSAAASVYLVDEDGHWYETGLMTASGGSPTGCAERLLKKTGHEERRVWEHEIQEVPAGALVQ